MATVEDTIEGMPAMMPVDIRSLTLSQDLHGWDVWEGQSEVAYLRFSGQAASPLDIMNVKWRVNEAFRITRCQKLLIDFRNLELPSAGLDVSALRQKTRSKQILIAIKDTAVLSLLRNAQDGEVSDDFSSLAADATAVSPDRVDSLLDSMERIDLAISPLHCRFAYWPTSSDELQNGFIAVSGYYRRGSDGKPDGMWIRWQIDEFCEYFKPHSLLVDLRELDYEWGDDLFIHPTDTVEGHIRIVVQSSRLDAFSGVLGEHDLRTDLEVALSEITASQR